MTAVRSPDAYRTQLYDDARTALANVLDARLGMPAAAEEQLCNMFVACFTELRLLMNMKNKEPYYNSISAFPIHTDTASWVNRGARPGVIVALREFIRASHARTSEPNAGTGKMVVYCRNGHQLGPLLTLVNVLGEHHDVCIGLRLDEENSMYLSSHYDPPSSHWYKKKKVSWDSILAMCLVMEETNMTRMGAHGAACMSMDLAAALWQMLEHMTHDMHRCVQCDEGNPLLGSLTEIVPAAGMSDASQDIDTVAVAAMLRADISLFLRCLEVGCSAGKTGWSTVRLSDESGDRETQARVTESDCAVQANMSVATDPDSHSNRYQMCMNLHVQPDLDLFRGQHGFVRLRLVACSPMLVRA